MVSFMWISLFLFQCWWFQWQPHSCWLCWWILCLVCRPGVLSNLCNLVTGKGDMIPPKRLRRTTLFPKQIQHRSYHPSYITLLDVKLIKLNPTSWTALSWFCYLSQLILLLCTEDIHMNSQMFAPGHAGSECKQSHYSLLCSLYHMDYERDDLPLCLLTKNGIDLTSVGLWNLNTSEVTKQCPRPGHCRSLSSLTASAHLCNQTASTGSWL